MLKVSLDDDERWRLEESFRCTPDRRLRNRCQAILMAARGRRHRQIAEDLGISVRTLQRWFNAYQTGGLEGLTIQWAAAQPPYSSGLGAELAAYLYRMHGIAVSERTMRLCCRKHGVRPSRPTSRYLKADPAQQTAAQRDLQAFKPRRGSWSCCAKMKRASR